MKISPLAWQTCTTRFISRCATSHRRLLNRDSRPVALTPQVSGYKLREWGERRRYGAARNDMRSAIDHEKHLHP